MPGSNGKLNMKRYFHYFGDQRKVQPPRIKLRKLHRQKKEAEYGEILQIPYELELDNDKKKIAEGRTHWHTYSTVAYIRDKKRRNTIELGVRYRHFLQNLRYIKKIQKLVKLQ